MLKVCTECPIIKPVCGMKLHVLANEKNHTEKLLGSFIIPVDSNKEEIVL